MPTPRDNSNLIRNFNTRQQSKYSGSLQVPKIQAPALRDAAPVKDNQLKVAQPPASPSVEQLQAPPQLPNLTPYDVNAELNAKLQRSLPTLLNGQPNDGERRTNAFYNFLGDTIEESRKYEAQRVALMPRLSQFNTHSQARPNGFGSNVLGFLFGRENTADDGTLGNEFDIRKGKFGQYGGGAIGGLMYGLDQTLGLGALRNILLDVATNTKAQAQGWVAPGGVFDTLFKTRDPRQAWVAGLNRADQARREIYGDSMTSFFRQGLMGRDLGALGNLSGDAKDDYYKLYGRSPLASGLDRVFFGRELTEQETKDYEKLTGFSVKQYARLSFSPEEMEEYQQILSRVPEDFKTKMLLRNGLGLVADIGADDLVKPFFTSARNVARASGGVTAELSAPIEPPINQTRRMQDNTRRRVQEWQQLKQGTGDAWTHTIDVEATRLFDNEQAIPDPWINTKFEPIADPWVDAPIQRALPPGVDKLPPDTSIPFKAPDFAVANDVLTTKPPRRLDVPALPDPWQGTPSTAAAIVSSPPPQASPIQQRLLPPSDEVTIDLWTSAAPSLAISPPNPVATNDVAAILAAQYQRRLQPGRYIVQELSDPSWLDPLIMSMASTPPPAVENPARLLLPPPSETPSQPISVMEEYARKTDVKSFVRKGREVLNQEKDTVIETTAAIDEALEQKELPPLIKTTPSSVEATVEQIVESSVIRQQQIGESSPQQESFRMEKLYDVDKMVPGTSKYAEAMKKRYQQELEKQGLSQDTIKSLVDKYRVGEPIRLPRPFTDWRSERSTALTRKEREQLTLWRESLATRVKNAVKKLSVFPVNNSREFRLRFDTEEGREFLKEAVDLHGLFNRSYDLTELDTMLSMVSRAAAGAPVSFVGKVVPIASASRSQKEIYRFASLVPHPNNATKPLLPPTESVVKAYLATYGVEHPYASFAIKDESMKYLTSKGGVRPHKTLEDIAAEQTNPLYRKIISPGATPVPEEIIRHFELQSVTRQALIRNSADTVVVIDQAPKAGKASIVVVEDSFAAMDRATAQAQIKASNTGIKANLKTEDMRNALRILNEKGIEAVPDEYFTKAALASRRKKSIQGGTTAAEVSEAHFWGMTAKKVVEEGAVQGVTTNNKAKQERVEKLEKKISKVEASETLEDFEEAITRLEDMEPSLAELDAIEKKRGRNVFDHRKKLSQPSHTPEIESLKEARPDIVQKQEEFNELTTKLDEVVVQETKLLQTKASIEVSLSNVEIQQEARVKSYMERLSLPRDTARSLDLVVESLKNNVGNKELLDAPRSFIKSRKKAHKDVEQTVLDLREPSYFPNYDQLRKDFYNEKETLRAVSFLAFGGGGGKKKVTNPVVRILEDGSLEFISGRETTLILKDAGADSIPVQIVRTTVEDPNAGVVDTTAVINERIVEQPLEEVADEALKKLQEIEASTRTKPEVAVEPEKPSSISNLPSFSWDNLFGQGVVPGIPKKLLNEASAEQELYEAFDVRVPRKVGDVINSPEVREVWFAPSKAGNKKETKTYVIFKDTDSFNSWVGLGARYDDTIKEGKVLLPENTRFKIIEIRDAEHPGAINKTRTLVANAIAKPSPSSPKSVVVNKPEESSSPHVSDNELDEIEAYLDRAYQYDEDPEGLFDDFAMVSLQARFGDVWSQLKSSDAPPELGDFTSYIHGAEKMFAPKLYNAMYELLDRSLSRMTPEQVIKAASDIAYGKELALHPPNTMSDLFIIHSDGQMYYGGSGKKPYLSDGTLYEKPSSSSGEVPPVGKTDNGSSSSDNNPLIEILDLVDEQVRGFWPDVNFEDGQTASGLMSAKIAKAKERLRANPKDVPAYVEVIGYLQSLESKKILDLATPSTDKKWLLVKRLIEGQPGVPMRFTNAVAEHLGVTQEYADLRKIGKLMDELPEESSKFSPQDYADIVYEAFGVPFFFSSNDSIKDIKGWAEHFLEIARDTGKEPLEFALAKKYGVDASAMFHGTGRTASMHTAVVGFVHTEELWKGKKVWIDSCQTNCLRYTGLPPSQYIIDWTHKDGSMSVFSAVLPEYSVKFSPEDLEEIKNFTNSPPPSSTTEPASLDDLATFSTIPVSEKHAELEDWIEYAREFAGIDIVAPPKDSVSVGDFKLFYEAFAGILSGAKERRHPAVRKLLKIVDEGKGKDFRGVPSPDEIVDLSITEQQAFRGLVTRWLLSSNKRELDTPAKFKKFVIENPNAGRYLVHKREEVLPNVSNDMTLSADGANVDPISEALKRSSNTLSREPLSRQNIQDASALFEKKFDTGNIIEPSSSLDPVSPGDGLGLKEWLSKITDTQGFRTAKQSLDSDKVVAFKQDLNRMLLNNPKIRSSIYRAGLRDTDFKKVVDTFVNNPQSYNARFLFNEFVQKTMYSSLNAMESVHGAVAKLFGLENTTMTKLSPGAAKYIAELRRSGETALKNKLRKMSRKELVTDLKKVLGKDVVVHQNINMDELIGAFFQSVRNLATNNKTFMKILEDVDVVFHAHGEGRSFKSWMTEVAAAAESKKGTSTRSSLRSVMESERFKGKRVLITSCQTNCPRYFTETIPTYHIYDGAEKLFKQAQFNVPKATTPSSTSRKLKYVPFPNQQPSSFLNAVPATDSLRRGETDALLSASPLQVRDKELKVPKRRNELVKLPNTTREAMTSFKEALQRVRETGQLDAPTQLKLNNAVYAMEFYKENPGIAREMREVVRRMTGRELDEGKPFMSAAVDLLNDDKQNWSRLEVADLVSYGVGVKDVKFAANMTDEEVLKFGRRMLEYPETMSQFDYLYVGHGTGIVEHGTWSLEARPSTGYTRRELIQHVIDREFPKGVEVGVAACETGSPKRIQDAVPPLHRVVSRGQVQSSLDNLQHLVEALSAMPTSEKVMDVLAHYDNLLREALGANKQRGIEILTRMSELEDEFNQITKTQKFANERRARRDMDAAFKAIEKELLDEGGC